MSKIANTKNWMNILAEIAKSLGKKLNKMKLIDIQILLTKKLIFFKRYKCSCILINSSEEEAFVFADSELFSEIILVTDEKLHEEYNQNLNETKIRSERPDRIKNLSGLFYFGDPKIYRDYQINISLLSLILIKTKYLDSFDSILRFGEFYDFILFSKICNTMIKQIEINDFNKLCQVFETESFAKKLYEIKILIDNSIENPGTFKTNCSELLNEFINYLLREFDEKSIQDSETLINLMHKSFLIQDKKFIIYYLIIYITSSLKKIINDMRPQASIDIALLSQKFKSFSILVSFKIPMIVIECIINPKISEFVVTCLFELFNYDPENFECLSESLEDIKSVDASSDPDLFNFFENDLKNHLLKLLENNLILQGYKDLDTIVIEAESLDKAVDELVKKSFTQSFWFDDLEILDIVGNNYYFAPKKEMHRSLYTIKIEGNSLDEVVNKLIEITSKQLSPCTFSIEDLEAVDNIGSIYYFIFYDKAIKEHLISLIPKELIIVPTLKSKKKFKFSGKTLIGGKIALKSYLATPKNKITKARLIVCIVHEISHNKRLIYANNSNFLPLTPDKFLNEAGFFMDKLIYGEHVRGASCNFLKITNKIAEKILNRIHLSQAEAEEIFSSRNSLSLMELSENDDEGWEPICTGRVISIFSPKYY